MELQAASFEGFSADEVRAAVVVTAALVCDRLRATRAEVCP